MAPTATKKAPVKYLSRADFARYVGLKSVRSLSKYTLPEPDVEVGPHKGWTTETADAWMEARPGRGRWGQRQADRNRTQA
ncbi:helix-turn-helix DNA binding domain protein [Gordonia phage Evaa]|nr:helix-turn-helix DNA binding domain protein [Gordonia phage Evaa]